MIRIASVLTSCAAALFLPAAATAEKTGGTSMPDPPSIAGAACVAGPAVPCAGNRLQPGATLRLTGSGLRPTQRLIFTGRPGRGDDRAARPRHRGPSHVEVDVPRDARSGRVVAEIRGFGRVVAPGKVHISRAKPMAAGAGQRTFFVGGRSRPSLTFQVVRPGTATVEVLDSATGAVAGQFATEVAPGPAKVAWDGQLTGSPAPAGRYALRVAAAAAQALGAEPVVGQPFMLADHIFPIRGRHDLGQSATNNFGGQRNHQGQDMFAACGTRLAAAQGGTVKFADTDGRAGNYVVITGAVSGRDYVYMHMRQPSPLKKGDPVATGQRIGEVGDTGNASGCHLHFELWSAPGWFTGGQAIDALPLLKTWDGWS